MKQKILLFVILILVISCNPKEKKPDEVILSKKENTELAVLENTESDYIIDSLVLRDVEILGKKYKSVPFYANIDGNYFYIICDQNWEEYQKEIFSGKFNYGITNNKLETILELKYNKIYNPNLTLLNCFEIKLNSKVGLFNYINNEILYAQFDFILPESNTIGTKAYGYKNNEWYLISNNSFNEIKLVDFNPSSVLKGINFDAKKIGSSMLYNSYLKEKSSNGNDYYSNNNGYGVIIYPSYIDYLKLFSESYLDRFATVENQMKDENYSTELNLNTYNNYLIKEKLMAFFTSAYNYGIAGRPYVNSSKKLIIYNTSSKKIFQTQIGSNDDNNQVSKEFSYKFIMDTILEVKINTFEHDYNLKKQLYNYQTNYRYSVINNEGQIIKLSTSRLFPYTKFVFIDNNYFKGSFVKTVNIAKYQDKYVKSNHLTIDDLEIMKNEIFAEYGYIFKNKKWEMYFSKKAWYHGKYDNVDSMLTEIDKYNLKIILNMIKNMTGKSEIFINIKDTILDMSG